MLKASAFEFRFRVWIMLAILVLGFWVPWLVANRFESLALGPQTTAWLWLGFRLSRLGIAPGVAIELVTVLIILVAAVAAVFRVWGTAYLGVGTVNHPDMKANLLLADGPYRHVRNPLYIGTFLVLAAIAALMTPLGALFTLILVSVLLIRLIFAEEAFLTGQLGAPYTAYRQAVPRIVPSPQPRVAAAGQKPQWARAIGGEMFALGVLASFGILSWQYNAELILRGVLISYGLSLIIRALLVQGARQNQS